MELTKNKGFTLIELLVVVAIVSLLSSIVFSSLNSARAKARDANIKSQLSSLRSVAEVVYTNTGSYNTLCDLATNSGLIFKSASDQSTRVLNESVCSSSGGNILYMNASGVLVVGGKVATPDKWGASIRLVNSSNFFCVDYTGIAREQATIGIYFGGGGTTDVDC